MSRFINEDKYWSKDAKKYERNTEFVVGKDLFDAIEEEIDELKFLGKTLELGCGTGLYTSMVAENSDFIISTDISDVMINISENKHKDVKKIKVMKLNARDTDFIEGSFDTIFMANLINNIMKPEEVLKESKRILNDKGMMIIVAYTSNKLYLAYKIKYIIRYLKRFGFPKMYFKEYSQSSLSSLVDKEGFKIVSNRLILGKKMNAIIITARKKQLYI